MTDFNYLPQGKGWAIFLADGSMYNHDGSRPYQLQRIDEDEIFDSDYDAWAFVIARAYAGDEICRAALTFLKIESLPEYDDILSGRFTRDYTPDNDVFTDRNRITTPTITDNGPYLDVEFFYQGDPCVKARLTFDTQLRRTSVMIVWSVTPTEGFEQEKSATEKQRLAIVSRLPVSVRDKILTTVLEEA